jgi:hypothetical protein
MIECAKKFALIMMGGTLISSLLLFVCGSVSLLNSQELNICPKLCRIKARSLWWYDVQDECGNKGLIPLVLFPPPLLEDFVCYNQVARPYSFEWSSDRPKAILDFINAVILCILSGAFIILRCYLSSINDGHTVDNINLITFKRKRLLIVLYVTLITVGIVLLCAVFAHKEYHLLQPCSTICETINGTVRNSCGRYDKLDHKPNNTFECWSKMTNPFTYSTHNYGILVIIASVFVRHWVVFFITCLGTIIALLRV